MYVAKHTVSHDGKTYAPGEVVDIRDRTALNRLLDLGAIEKRLIEASEPELTGIQAFPVAEAQKVIADVKDLEGLATLEEQEVAHPKYEGGREGILKSIAARRQQLEAPEGD